MRTPCLLSALLVVQSLMGHAVAVRKTKPFRNGACYKADIKKPKGEFPNGFCRIVEAGQPAIKVPCSKDSPCKTGTKDTGKTKSATKSVVDNCIVIKTSEDSDADLEDIAWCSMKDADKAKELKDAHIANGGTIGIIHRNPVERKRKPESASEPRKKKELPSRRVLWLKGAVVMTEPDKYPNGRCGVTDAHVYTPVPCRHDAKSDIHADNGLQCWLRRGDNPREAYCSMAKEEAMQKWTAAHGGAPADAPLQEEGAGENYFLADSDAEAAMDSFMQSSQTHAGPS